MPQDPFDAAEAVGQAQPDIGHVSVASLLHHLRIGYLGPSHDHQVGLLLGDHIVSHDRVLYSTHDADRNGDMLLDLLAEMGEDALFLVHWHHRVVERAHGAGTGR